MARHFEEVGPDEAEVTDDETRDKLRQLGYIE
jgi:hypothetical protein